MTSDAPTVEEYLAALPDDRRDAMAALRATMRDNRPDGVEERMLYGMIGYVIPHSIYPAGYQCDPTKPLSFAGLASQKNYISIYLSCIYMTETHRQWFADAWVSTGKKLDMGKSCIRVKKLSDVPLDVLAAAMRRVSVDKMIAMYDANRPGTR